MTSIAPARRRYLSAALITLVAALLLPQRWLMPFTSHMVAHMSLVVIVAPLGALALAGSSRDPVNRYPRLMSPILASMVELVVVWAWHLPQLHHATSHPLVFALEQVSFLGAGLYLWLSALGGDQSLRHERSTQATTGLLLTSMHMTLLGALLVLAHRPLYASHQHHGVQGLSGLSQLLWDQHIGGAVMLLSGGLAYLIGGLARVASVFRNHSEHTTAAPRPRAPTVPMPGARPT